MTVLTDTQLAGYARGAGFPESVIPTMVAIALAESSGNTNASNPSGAKGLWQVMWALHGETGNAYDPATNAAAAYRVYKSQGLRAWTAYSTGAYLLYMGRGKTAASSATNLGVASSSSGQSTATDASSGAGLSGSVATATAPGTWARIGEFILGAILIFFAIIRISGADRIVIKGIKAGAALK